MALSPDINDREHQKFAADGTVKVSLPSGITPGTGKPKSGASAANTTPGTAIQVSTVSIPCYRVFVSSFENNGGTITVGDSTVKAVLSTARTGHPFFATQGDWFYVSNVNLLYFDVINSGDFVTFVAEVPS